MELLNFGPKKLGFGCMRLRYGRCLSGAGLLLF